MFKNPFSREKEKSSREIIVVSGLPRSGTSMMMKMLAEGGLDAVTDALRTADDDNPNGYFEFEPVKQMTEGNTRYRYKVIFMERSLQEVLRSQKKMLVNRAEDSAISDSEMEERFKKHLAAVKFWLARQPNIEVLYVDYARMIASPRDHCAMIADFIGLPLDIEKMQQVPSQQLYRNRAASS
jgi:hypothetical protein